MANMFFNDEKESKEDAVKSVSKFIVDYCECVFVVKTVSDDGGRILQVMVEVGDVSKSLAEQKPDFPLSDLVPKWHGWRAVIMKVPVGYIDAIVNANDD